MSIATLKERLPEYARDLKINLANLPTLEGLTPRQLWGTAVAAAVAARNPELLAAITEDARPHLDDAAFKAARGAAALMGMNNIYYRFLHLVEDEEYAKIPARLRMQLIGNPGIDKVDFELFCLAVSAQNGCASCVRSHERNVREHGVDRPVVQAAVRIAAIVQAVAVTLDAEKAAA